MDYFVQKGYVVKGFGFEVFSDKYNFYHSIEKGKPDLVIYDKFGKLLFYVEVTGVRYVDVMVDVWIRPDKIEYAEKYCVDHIFIAYINDIFKMIRFCYISGFKVSDFKIVEPVIKGTKERYCVIPFGYFLENMFCSNLNEFM